MLAHSPVSVPTFLTGAPPSDPRAPSILTVDGAEIIRCAPAIARNLALDAIANHTAQNWAATFDWSVHFNAYIVRTALRAGSRVGVRA